MVGKWGAHLARPPGEPQPNATNALEDNRHALSSLHLLVEIASRMPLEPLPAMSEQARRREASPVTLPPLHDLLSGLANAPKRTLSVASASGDEDKRGRGGSESPPTGPSPSPRYWPLTAKMSTKSKRPIPMWPVSASELSRGVNDTWNSFQRANKGRSVTTAEWKAARSKLWAEHDANLKEGAAQG
jgi:hypothetical protein